MSYGGWRSPHSLWSGMFMAKAVRTIIIVNVTVFVLFHLSGRPAWMWLFALTPALVFRRFMLWQFFTYAFMHVEVWHLVINMLMLWFFGPAIEEMWGRRRFLFYYFLCGVGAGVCSFIVSFNSFSPVIGASGAIFGILVAYAMIFPEATILLFFIFPMRMRHAVLVLAGINLLGALSATGGGIAYAAHLGGALCGYLYLRSEWIRFKIASIDLGALGLRRRKKKIERKQVSRKDLDQEVDRLLDKISKQGMESLSQKERRILEQRSKGR